MARTIEFDVERIFRRLSALEATQVKYAAGRALNRFGYEAQQHLGLQMAGRFENPVRYSVNSPRYDNRLIEDSNSVAVRLYINPDSAKGNAPASYIFPTDASSGDNKAYLSRFARGLSKTNVTSKFPVAYKQGLKVPRNEYGNMAPYFYKSVLKALQAGRSGIFALPNGSPGYQNLRRANSLDGGGRAFLPPGIYMREGRQAYLLFSLLDEVPTIRKTIDVYDITNRLALQRLPVLLREQLAKALR